MNTKKNSSSVDMFSEHKVIEYVGGFLDKEAKSEFEKELTSNPALRRAVASERQLREALTVLDQCEADASDNFTADGVDKLFEKLDTAEQQATSSNHTSSKVFSLVPNRGWFALTAIAASVVFAAVIFVNFKPDHQTANFALLSSGSKTAEIEFNQLVKEHKVAQIWLANELTAQELSTLFSDNGLTPISRAGQAWVVSSSKALSTAEVANLEALTSLKRVSVISYD